MSSDPSRGEPGPRAHVLGVVNAFERRGWVVKTYLCGDRLPWLSGSVGGADTADLMARSGAIRLGADVARLALRPALPRLAWRHIGPCEWVYERYALMHALGRPFQRRGALWLLEVNSLYAEEAAIDRPATALRGAGRRMEADAIRSCDFLVVPTQELATSLAERYRIAARKIIVVPNGVDAQRFVPSFERPVPPEPVIVFSGRLLAWQGLDVLLRAVAELTEASIAYRVRVIGDGPERGTLTGLARALGVDDRVEFVGPCDWDAVPSFLAECDLGYVGHDGKRTALGRGYFSPLKLYEYLAAGLPVVASTAVEDARRVIADGLGFGFEAGDWVSLASALRRAWHVRGGWREIGRLARALVERDHSWDRRILDLVAAVDERRSARVPRAGGSQAR